MAKNRQSPGIISEAAKGTPTVSVVPVGSTATQIIGSNELRRVATIFNNDSAKTLYIGPDSSVTVGNGYPVPYQQSFQDTRTESAWWGICSSGTIDTRIIEVSAS